MIKVQYSWEGINSEKNEDYCTTRIAANYIQKLLWSDKMYISFERNNAALEK